MCRFLLLNVVGAILHLVDGTYKVNTFEYQKPDWVDEEGGDDMDGGEDSTTTATKYHDSVAGVCEEIRSLVAGNSIRLKDAFRAIENSPGDGEGESNNYVTIEQWANVVGQVLELEEIERDIITLQPMLAPQTTSVDGVVDMVDWKAFLDSNKGYFVMSQSLDEHNAEILHENSGMLLSVFNYLDADHDGKIGKEEFLRGVEVLNQRIPEDRRIVNPEKLFNELDLDHNDAIDVDEFKNFISLL